MARRVGMHLAVALIYFGFLGCGGPQGASPGPSGGKTPAGKAAGAGHDHAGHDHDHDHGHDHATDGPHGGHILELGEEEYHAEWKHEDATGKVTVFILDDKMKDEVPIAAAEITITTQVGENRKAYALAAANPSEGDAPKASRFEVEDQALVAALQAAGKEGTTAKLELEINGKKYSAAIEHDAEHGHKH